MNTNNTTRDCRDEKNIKNVTRKIKALLAKTVEAGATEAEAMSAFTLAHKLLEEYQLNLSDLDLREEGTSCVVQTMDNIARRMSRRVGEYCECKVWMSEPRPKFKYVKVGSKEKKVQDGKEYTKINFLGIKSDADFAEWLMAALSSYVQGKEVAFMFADFCASVEDAEDFTSGCINRINERLKLEIDKRNAKRATSTGRDLVPLKNAMITEAFNKLGLLLKDAERSHYRVMNREAYERGQNAGDGVSFNRPVHRDNYETKLLK